MKIVTPFAGALRHGFPFRDGGRGKRRLFAFRFEAKGSPRQSNATDALKLLSGAQNVISATVRIRRL